MADEERLEAPEPDPKPIVWVRSAKDDLREMPEEVRYDVGGTLFEIQCGGTPENVKPLHGKLAGVWEIRVDDKDGATYRTAYVAKFEEAVYVLDAFKKKSKTGIETPQRDIDRIEQRLKEAREQHERYKKDHRKD